MSVAGVLLAAGAGSRFLGPTHKLLADFKGRPLIEVSLEPLLAAGFDEVIVVSGAIDLVDHVPEVVTIIENHDWERGQASSLQAAVHYLERMGHETMIIGLADQPFVTTEAWQAVSATEGDIVTAVFDGQRRPPVKLDQITWPLLPLDGDQGARGLFRSRPDLVHEVACEGKPFDIDTQEDLERWS
ncbi:MAG: nucleotidyltransferase family protein [Acidimicrobiales bacterium]